MIILSNMFVKSVRNINAVVSDFSITLIIIYLNQDKNISNTSMLVFNI